MLAILPKESDGDIAYSPTTNQLVEDRDLETAVYLALFLDAPARVDDDVPKGAIRRGYWADAHATDGDITGSRLWLLERAKVTVATISRAKTYAEEALEWLVRDGVAKRVVVTSDRLIVSPETQGILLTVTVYRPDGTSWSAQWDALTGTEA